MKRRFLFGTTVLSGMIVLGGAAFAQANPQGVQTPPSQDGAQSAQSLEEVVVTGSRLRRESFDTPTPVLTIGAEEFERTGAGNVIEVLEEINLVGAGSNSRGANGQFGDNFAFVDLFNLGTERTLTLVNGRRFISGNQATTFVPDNATGAQVDLTVIPPSLVERVEVTPLTGGAIYGADAVGGVVNLILKDNFQGLELSAQYGITGQGDGERYRAGVTWGTNFYNDQGNITLSFDYFNQEGVRTGGKRDFLVRRGAMTNFDNSSIRSASLTGNDLANLLRGGATSLPAPFLPGAADFQRPNVYVGPLTNNMFTGGGLLTTGQSYPAGVSGGLALIPNTIMSSATFPVLRRPDGLPAFAYSFAALPAGVTATQVINTLAPGTSMTGLTAAQQNTLALSLLQRNLPTPREYFAANPGINPNLLIGSLYSQTGANAQGPLGVFPTILNPDPATSALFPRIAVPLQLNSAGALTSYNYGDPRLGSFGTGVGGDGFSNAALGYGNLLSATERSSFAALARFDITPSVTYRGEILYTDIAYRSIAGVDSNSLGGSTTAGNRAIPVYIDQNPFFSAANRAQINGLAAQGLNVPNQAGQRVLFLNRALRDIYDGPVESGNDVEMFRAAQSIEGEFGFFGRRFYWDASYVYGQNSILNIGENILDTEFALATDVVIGPGGTPVCRQQTLASPESIAIRNPALSAINTRLGLVPTQAQVDACVPFNIFGEYNSTITDQLRDYITADTSSKNEARQHYLQASLGGEIFRLPGGWISAGAQIEWRNESLDFRPGRDFATGAARNTTGTFSNGELRFLEYGYELAIPIFGPDFNLPFFRALELSGAYRIVDRDQKTLTAGYAAAPGVTDEVYQYSLRWKVSDDLQFRANKSTSVRSASIVQLYGAPGSGFVNGTDGLLPCTPLRITQGPNPANRRSNCISAVLLTVPGDVLAGFAGATPTDRATSFLNAYVPTVASRPAETAGNPFLNNEQSDAFGAGLTLTPRWIPRLTIAIDYYEATIEGQVGLVGVPLTINECFDQANFPNSSLSGTPACNLFTIGMRDASGNYINPTVNPLTGAPVSPISNPGAPAVANRPFEAAFFTYPNFNLAATKLEAATVEVRYNFALEDLIGARAASWGDIFLSWSAYNLRAFDVSSSGTFTDTNPAAGEAAEWEFRTDIAHRIGRLDHRLTYFRNSDTVGNVQTNPATYPEQDLTFQVPGAEVYNYSIGYRVRDDVNVRMSINNLFDTRGPFEDLGVVNDAVGRTFIFSVNGRF